MISTGKSKRLKLHIEGGETEEDVLEGPAEDEA